LLDPSEQFIELLELNLLGLWTKLTKREN